MSGKGTAMMQSLIDEVLEIAAEQGKEIARHAAEELAEWVKQWISLQFSKPEREIDVSFRKIPEMQRAARRKIQQEVRQIPAPSSRGVRKKATGK